jgi:hypothetical protein
VVVYQNYVFISHQQKIFIFIANHNPSFKF